MYYFCGKKTIEKHFRSVIMKEYSIFFIIIFIIALYIYSYFKYPKNISILQTRPYEFNIDMLLEKQPIIIENNQSNLDDLKSIFFKLNPNKYFNLSSSDIWHKNIYKYVAIQFQSNGEVLLCPPNTKMIIENNIKVEQEGKTIIPLKINANNIIYPYQYHIKFQPIHTLVSIF